MLETEGTGEYILRAVPPGRYLVRALPRVAESVRPCTVLFEDFEVELSPGATVERIWYPQLGGLVRLNFMGSRKGVQSSILDSDGQPVFLTYSWEGSTGSRTTSPRPLIPGLSEAYPALAPGDYWLHTRLSNGATS